MRVPLLEQQHIKDSHSALNAYDNKGAEVNTSDNKYSKNKMLGLIVIMLTIIGGASIVPFVHKIDVKSFYLKTIWRYATISVYFFPLAIYQLYTVSKKAPMSTIFNLSNAISIVKISICQVLWTLTLIKGSELTLVSHAYLFNTLNGIILVIFKLCSGGYLAKMEIIGTLITLGGSVVLAFDTNGEKGDGTKISIIGDLIALIGSIFGAFYFMIGSKLIKKLPAFVTSFSLAFSNVIISTLFGLAFDNIDFSFSPDTGIFGWLSSKHFVYVFFYVGILTGVFANGGYIISLLFYSPILVSNLMLLEPVNGQILACLLGVDNFPGMLTIFGGIITLFGLYYVSKGSVKTEKKEQEDRNALINV